MRLLNVNSLTFTEFFDDVPPYVTASHRWRGRDQEAMIDDVRTGLKQQKSGCDKVRGFARYIREHVSHVEWLWIDTCCVNQDSTAEVQEAVTSMFRIYSQAEACLAYLGDVTGGVDEPKFRQSEWFIRGWTLQELLASHVVLFLSASWEALGYKGAQGCTRIGVRICTGPALEATVSSITGISESVLHNYNKSKSLSVEERLAWVDGRKTTKEEDMSYSLFGLFDVSTFINYGEGAQKARARLLEEIRKASLSFSTQAINAEVDDSKAPCFYLPFGENRRFVGRASETEMLNRRFFVDADCQKMAIFGLGGIGKTQVALNFAYHVKSTQPDYSIFWVPALSVETFEQALNIIAQCLGLPRSQGQDVKEQVRQYLSGPASKKWLLIVDNVDDADIVLGTSTKTGLAECLPESPLGLTLFTSRTLEVAQSLVGSDVVEITRMQEEEALALLKSTLFPETLFGEQAIAIQLVDELDRLPLAITQASAYMSVNRITVRKYLQILLDTERDKIELLSTEIRDATRYKQAASAVATTWIISFNQIAERDPAASELLQFISCIEWKAIPQSILPSPGSEVNLISAIGTLCSYSFLDQRGDKEMYDMHRLVHLAAQFWNSRYGDRRKTQEAAMVHLADIFPHGEWEDRMIWREYLPHAARIRRDTAGEAVKEKAELCLRVGQCLHYNYDGKFGEETSWLEECYHWRSALPEDHLDRLETERWLALAYCNSGRVVEGTNMLERIVAIGETALSVDDPLQLASQHSLAAAYLKDFQFGKAIQLFEHIVRVDAPILAEGDLDKLMSQGLLAQAYVKDRQTKRAIGILEDIVKLDARMLAEDHPTRLTLLHELAGAHLDDGQVETAVHLFEQVVRIREGVLEDSHPDLLASQHGLALAYLADRRTKKALDLIEHIVAMKRQIYGEGNNSLLVSQCLLGVTYLKNGRVQEAINVLEHNVADCEHFLSPSHPDTLGAQKELVDAYRENGDIEKGQRLSEHIEEVESKISSESRTELQAEVTEVQSTEVDRDGTPASSIDEHNEHSRRANGANKRPSRGRRFTAKAVNLAHRLKGKKDG